MATKNTAAETETDTDGPLIDLNEADVKKLIARGKKRGYLTYDELNAALPQDEMSSEQIEDIMNGRPPRPPKDGSQAASRPPGGGATPSVNSGNAAAAT